MASSHIAFAEDVFVGYCECLPRRVAHFGAYCMGCSSRADAYLQEHEVPQGVDRGDLDTIVKLVNERLARERCAPHAAVLVQTGAKKRAPGKKGVSLPPGGVLISVTHLPNPHNKLDAFRLEQSIADADWPSRKRDQVKLFLWHHAEPQLRRVLARASKAVKLGKPVAVVCGHGRDRSPAVAELIAEHAVPGQVRLQHNDAEE